MSTPALGVGLALGAGEDAAGFARQLERVEQADALGLHSVWLPESHFRRGAVASPLLTLAAFAARSQQLRLGTTSLLLPVHHPLRVAAESATLDALSGGRLILGLGRGFRSPVFQGFGVAATSKRDRFDQALDAILAAWAGEAIDVADTHFGGDARAELRLPWSPTQRPHPPLVVAAFGRKGLLQAARRGLPYLASPLETLATLEENYALWRANRIEAAPQPGLEVPVMRSVYVARDGAEAKRVLEGLAKERPRMGRSAPPALVRAAAGPLEERVLVGEAAAVVEGIEAYREALGMDLLVARLELPGGDAEAGLERLASQVLPRLRPGDPTPLG